MRLILASLFALALAAPPLHAQQTPNFPLQQTMRDLVVDSGAQPEPALDTSVIFETVVAVEGAHWLRIYFDDVQLAPGSFIRMTARKDGAVQELDAVGIDQWGGTSAYFNGAAVRLELIAAAGTADNRFRLKGVAHSRLDEATATGAPGECGICGGADDRVSSSEEWTSRLFPAGCTASIIGEDSCMVTAGHCIFGNMVVQFNVPNSTSSCIPVNPPPADQYPIIDSISQENGPGDDWAVIKAGSSQGQTPYERYGVLRPVTTEIAPVGGLVEVTGYGTDVTCTLSQTQQYANGTICQRFSDAYTFAVDITGGNSGSALIYNDAVIGIVTHCPCCNVATRIDNADVQQALADMCIPPEALTTTLPFFDDFEDVALLPELWTGVDGADVWIDGLNEPSGQISMRLDATNPGGDQARSAIMDTSAGGLKLTYWYEQTGAADSPEDGDDLVVEYFDAAENWVELNRHLGSGPDMTEYEFVSIPLPHAAQHPGFRIRFRAVSDESGEVDTHWIDDVCIGTDADCPEPTNCPWDCQATPNGTVDVADFLAMLADWGQVGVPCDVDGDGVSVTDFLELLANFGACP
jgi:V8-like Glu-specific endopeptidase